jgi:RNA polymerase sigma-32 factor
LARTAALPILSGETGLTRYLEEIRRFPMLEPQEEFMLAKRWREHGDRDAAHRLVTSHLRLVAKIAMGYRGYGLPIAEVISEGNVGLMQAVKRFEPDKGFRLATYAMWWIKAAIQEYIQRSWSLVKMGTTANQKKLFFNLRKAKSRISALDEGDMRPDQVKLIAKRLGVTEQDVIDMNRRLGGDASLNTPIREDGDSGEWMDWLVDDSASQESRLAESEEMENRQKALGNAITVLNDRERRIFEARRLADDPITLEELADEFGVSRERVRQIEVRAFEKVQKAVKKTSPAWKNPQPIRRYGLAGSIKQQNCQAQIRPWSDATDLSISAREFDQPWVDAAHAKIKVLPIATTTGIVATWRKATRPLIRPVSTSTSPLRNSRKVRVRVPFGSPLCAKAPQAMVSPSSITTVKVVTAGSRKGSLPATVNQIAAINAAGAISGMAIAIGCMSLVGGIFAMGLPATFVVAIKRSRRDDLLGICCRGDSCSSGGCRATLFMAYSRIHGARSLPLSLKTNAPRLSNRRIDGGGVYSRINRAALLASFMKT